MIKYGKELQGEQYTLLTDSQDLKELAKYLGLPKIDRSELTGAIVEIKDGDYAEIWLTDWSVVGSLETMYRSPEDWDAKHIDWKVTHYTRSYFTSKRYRDGRHFTEKGLTAWRLELCAQLRNKGEAGLASQYMKMSLKAFGAQGGYVIVEAK